MIPFFIRVVIKIKLVVCLQRHVSCGLTIVPQTVDWNQLDGMRHGRDRDHRHLTVNTTISSMEGFTPYLVHLHHLIRTTKHLKEFDEKQRHPKRCREGSLLRLKKIEDDTDLGYKRHILQEIQLGKPANANKNRLTFMTGIVEENGVTFAKGELSRRR